MQTILDTLEKSWSKSIKVKKEYEINRAWLEDEDGFEYGETNFVISEDFANEHYKECPNYDGETLEEFLNIYVPEVDGQYLYDLARKADAIIEDIGPVTY